MDLHNLLKKYENCECGQIHSCNVKDVRVGSGLIKEVGNILKENSFPKDLLLVSDKTVFAACGEITDSLKDFNVTTYIYDFLRVATMDDVEFIESLIKGKNIGVLAVGTGSIDDTCRLAAARQNKPLCLFGTAPSMDGFASDTAPIVKNNFKTSYKAKSPEVIIGDTKILAAAPVELKRAGFGDMIAKYVALIDWQASNLISGEKYCERVASLTRFAADNVFEKADLVTAKDEETAGKIFEGLLYTGIAMSFTGTSRPASGTEHIISHYIECKQLLDGITPNYHGEDVGVATLLVLRLYNSLLSLEKITGKKDDTDWKEVEEVYGDLKEDMIKLNAPDTITDGIDPRAIEENFDKIKEIIRSVPSYDQVKEAMEKAGCKLTYEDIGKSERLMREAFLYHTYMRRRLSLLRLLYLTDFKEKLKTFPLK
ncbi:MAG: iron-containing alcohol dehydrogenase [Clostridia bacterium]|nr:iron-containing alcohol dehydrogenase [Clostridia bacterium]